MSIGNLSAKSLSEMARTFVISPTAETFMDGLSTYDFARKHRFTEKHTTRLLNILREEAGLPLPQAT